MNRTKISWCDFTTNPIRATTTSSQIGSRARVGWHCEKIASGCQNCYASTLNNRFGTQEPFTKASRSRVHVYLDGDELAHLLKYHPRGPFKFGPRPVVFPCDMTDLFGEWVSDEWLDRIFAAFALRPDFIFTPLTKRGLRMVEYITSRTVGEFERVPLPNVYLGHSASDQPTTDDACAHLAKLAALGWRTYLSLEPQVGAVTLPAGFPAVIQGGESGPKARPFNIEWARAVRDQCKAAGVPLWVKQIHLNGRVSEDPSEWPGDIRVRQLPWQQSSEKQG